MSTALVAVDKTSIAAFIPDREKVELIKQTVARGCSDVELELFLYTAKRTGLDPLLKQIYAIKRWDSNLGKEAMTIQTGIDGFRVVASRTAKLAGIEDAVFEESNGQPVKATVTVYKLDELGQPRAYTASARMSEYLQTKKSGEPTSFWKRMPYGQLGKCAEALALRKAFPADLSGVYSFDEMHQAVEADEHSNHTEATAVPLLETEVKLDCFDCQQEIDAVTIKGVFYPLEKVKAANLKDFPDVNLCAYCQIQRHRLQREMSTQDAVPAEGGVKVPSETLGSAAPVQHTDSIAAYDAESAVNDETGRAVGVVKKVWPKSGKKPYAISLQIQGDVLHFSTFSETEGKKMAGSEGQRIVLSFVKDGKYRNINTIEKIGSQDFVVDGEPF